MLTLRTITRCLALACALAGPACGDSSGESGGATMDASPSDSAVADAEPVDASAACAASEIDCGGTCIDPLTSEDFCGAQDDCVDPGTVCDTSAGEVCTEGSCDSFVCSGSFDIENSVELMALEPCTLIDGFLVVGSSIDPASLPNLVAVTGNVSLRSPIAFPELRTVGRSLSLRGAFFTSIESFVPRLERVSRFSASLTGLSDFQPGFEVSSAGLSFNSQLTSLDGLVFGQSVDGIGIRDNPVLSDLSALAGVTTVSGDIELKNLDAATDLSPLSNIVSVGLSFAVENVAATAIDWPNLRTVIGTLGFVGNGALRTINLDMPTIRLLNLDGNSELTELLLEETTEFVGNLLIRSNTSLATLDGLANVQSVGGNVLTIQGNTSLPTCAAEAFVDQVNFGPGATVLGNDDDGVCPP